VIPRSPSRHEAASQVWVGMRAFVEANEHPADLRERLGLALGTGRVKALLLLRDGPLSLSRLAAAHAVDAPYATIIVDRLESLGYVERTVDPTDRRRKLVALTATGLVAVAVAVEALSSPPEALQLLSETELSQLQTLLARLTSPSE